MLSCRPSRRAVMLRLAAAGGVLAAGGCGYRPLYAKRSAGGVVSEELAQVRVASIRDRPGQQLRNLLLDRFNPDGRPRDPRYELAVMLTETRQELGIRKDESATRANLIVTAAYRLVELDSGAVAFRASSTSQNSFNIVRSDFAVIAAEEDARSRALRELSDQIQLRLATYFNRRGGTAATGS